MVEDGEDGGEEGAEEGHGEAEEVVGFDAGDEGDAAADDEAEDDFVGADAAAIEEGFGEGGEEGGGGEADEGDRDVGEFDGGEEADPVESDDEADAEGLEDVGFRKAKEGGAFGGEPEAHDECGDEGAPKNEGGGLEGQEGRQDAGDGKEDDDEMELEEGGDFFSDQ